MTEAAKAIAEDPQTMDSLAEDIASEMEDELEDNQEIRKQIVDAAMANPEFKKKIAVKLTEELS